MVWNARVAALGAVLVALAMGCGKAPPPPIVAAEGVVRLDGRPLNKAVVRFIPEIDYDQEYIAAGVTDESGHFKLTCKGQPGACAGQNRVLVMDSDIPREYQGENAQVQMAHYLESLGGRPLPPRYGNLVDSPLTADVKAGRAEYDFDLAR